jgi:hypothetical protein
MIWSPISEISDINEFLCIDAISVVSLSGEVYQLVREDSDFVNNRTNFPISWITKEDKKFLIQDPYCKEVVLIINKYIRKIDR